MDEGKAEGPKLPDEGKKSQIAKEPDQTRGAARRWKESKKKRFTCWGAKGDHEGEASASR